MTEQRTKQARWLQGLLLISTALLIVGIFSPMMTITQFFLFDHSFSVISGIGQLFAEGKLFLFVLIALFSIVLPIAKIALLFNLLSTKNDIGSRRKKLLQLMHDYGRWAMLDVMVVAILIVTVKLGAIASIQIHSGLYIFGSAVLLIMVLTHYAVKFIQQP
ncbi:MAG: paraquat-inducible membrane protein A [Gammaproteobacteria bacterium]|nr:MAG: paraquat-inducible membrane protein A [Gammaproteobacteria bacterium]